MKQLFAEHAWLGPGKFAERVLVTFDSHVHEVRRLAADEQPPPGAQRVQMLTPGFINAHCHLEYTWLGLSPGDEARAALRGPIPFGQWMQAIMATRPTSAEDQQKRLDGMLVGTRMLADGGCTSVIDSTTDGSSAGALRGAGLRALLFHEVLGLSRQRAEPLLHGAVRRTRDKTADALFLGHGLNPHAPYSVGAWLRRQLTGNDVAPVAQAWHLAETQDEDELFRAGTGSIAEFFEGIGLPMPWQEEQGDIANVRDQADSPGISAFQFLEREEQLERCVLAFHGNTLSPAEAAYFRAPRGLVHCPGTHRWFSRSLVPLREWLDAGVNVCLGTDSLASSENLSMLDMMRTTLADNLNLSAEDVLQMTCVNPCKISFIKEKGLSGEVRREEPADFVALKTHTWAGWRAALCDQETSVRKSWVSGDSVSRSQE